MGLCYNLIDPSSFGWHFATNSSTHIDAMSSSAQQPSLPPKDDREKRGIGFGKVFSRVKIALRRGDSSSAKAKPPAATAPLQPPPSKAQPDTKRYDAFESGFLEATTVVPLVAAHCQD